jgi:hypothetical protein
MLTRVGRTIGRRQERGKGDEKEER